jgi:hypothetical protein
MGLTAHLSRREFYADLAPNAPARAKGIRHYIGSDTETNPQVRLAQSGPASRTNRRAGAD